MSLKYGILGLLNYGPTTGYDLDKTFKESLNFFWQAQTSQIYRELNAMEKQGWITSEIIIQTDKPNKKLYSMTDAGRDELKRWLTFDSVEEDIRVRDPFLVKLFFSGELDAEKNIETMRVFQQCCEKELAEIQATIENCKQMKNMGVAPVYWGMTAYFGRDYYQMCISWADNMMKEMERMK
jgi:PadR family transcriptional regulator, regulatory protein AphA